MRNDTCVRPIVRRIALSCMAVVVSDARAEEPSPIPIAEIQRDEPVDFEKEILPFLRKNCLACHNSTDAESDLVMETPQAILKGGTEGPAAVPGKGSESLLLQVAAHRMEPLMPPSDNDAGAVPLSSEQLGLLKRWIDEGAEGEVRGDRIKINWQSLPIDVNPILAAAVTKDGRLTACGRANRLYVYHLPTGRMVGHLVDPDLLPADAPNGSGAAHVDLIHSLVFNPSGDRLASGGYRTVKLWRRPSDIRRRQFEVEGHGKVLAVTSDRRWIACGQEDGLVQLFDTQADRSPVELAGHTAEVTDLAFSADGAWLYSGSLDATLRLWHVAEARTVGGLKTGTAIHAIALINGGAQLVTGGSDAILRVWEAPQPAEQEGDTEVSPSLTEATPLREIQGHGRQITSLASLTNAPQQFISGSVDGTLRHWDANEGRQIRVFIHGGPVMSVAVRADGSRMVAAGENHVAKLWNAADGQLIAELKGDHRSAWQTEEMGRAVQVAKADVADLKQLLEEVKKKADSADEAVKKAQQNHAEAEKALMASGQAAKDALEAKMSAEQSAQMAAVALQKAEEDRAIAEPTVEKIRLVFENVQKQVNEIHQQAAKDSDAKDGDVKDSDTKDSDEMKHVLAAVQQAAAEAAAKQKQITDELLAKVKARYEEATKQVEQSKGQIESLAKKLEEAEVAAKEAEVKKKKSAAAVVDAQQVNDTTREKVATTEHELADGEQAVQALEAAKTEKVAAEKQSQCDFLSVAFSGDNQWLVLGDELHRIHLLDANAGEPYRLLEGHSGPVHAVQFTSDGDLVSLAADRRIYAWNVDANWILERTIGNIDDPSQFVDRVLALHFSPDGQFLATGGGEPSRSGQLKVWRVADGQLVWEANDAHSDTIFGLEFSPSGNSIASAAADRMVKVFQANDGKLIRTFEGHTHHVLDVCWQAQGKRLASAGADNVVKIWDFDEAGAQKRTISGFGKEVTSVSFAGISDTTVSSSGDATIRLHNSGNGKELRSIQGGDEFVYASAVSSDGATIVAGGVDSVLRVWDAKEGKLLIALQPLSAARP